MKFEEAVRCLIIEGKPVCSFRDGKIYDEYTDAEDFANLEPNEVDYEWGLLDFNTWVKKPFKEAVIELLRGKTIRSIDKSFSDKFVLNVYENERDFAYYLTANEVENGEWEVLDKEP